MQTRMLLLILLLGGLPVGARGADRDPAAVAETILRNPTAQHAGTLLAALQGCGCRPKHHAVRDAIVSVGKPVVPRLVQRLNSSTQWWVQLECVYLLGLIGPHAEEAIPTLKNPTMIKHGLPRSYVDVSLAAIRGDADALAAFISGPHRAPTAFAVELLGRRGPEQARPRLVKILQETNSTATRELVREALNHLDADQK